MQTELKDFLNLWEQETEGTLSLMQALPHHQYDFRPDPGGRSVGELAWHLAEIDAYISLAIAQGHFNFDVKPPHIERPKTVGGARSCLSRGASGSRIQNQPAQRERPRSRDPLRGWTTMEHPQSSEAQTAAPFGTPPRPVNLALPHVGWCTSWLVWPYARSDGSTTKIIGHAVENGTPAARWGSFPL